MQQRAGHSRTGTATLPLHYGKAPRWLFGRMTALSRQIAYYMVLEFGADAFLARLSDPYWFQALGCVLGFDWHSSGLTTTVTGAIKSGLEGMEKELGIYAAGGKGSASRKTPEEIIRHSEVIHIEPEPLVYASRMSAKVDNTAVQDGYQLYHHAFFFTDGCQWAVVQQGMNPDNRSARRYHWLSGSISSFVVEPHSAICSDLRGPTLDMTALDSEEARVGSARIACERPEKIIRELNLPLRHDVRLSDVDPKRLGRILLKTYERQPDGFETLLGIKGVGPKAIRALSLLSELMHGSAPSFRDPARFSFAHGGKDGTPYFVDRKTYDRTIEVLKKAVSSSKIGNRDKSEAIKRLHKYFE